MDHPSKLLHVIVRPVESTSGRWSVKTWSMTHVGEAPPNDIASGDLHLQMTVTLYPDQSGQYTYNLRSPTPQIFLVCDSDESGGNPVPRLLTVSPDEAAAYLEGEGEVINRPLPEELRAWLEAFTARYPEKEPFRKRKRV